MPIPDDLKNMPLADMVLPAVADPASIVHRERRQDGRRERIADHRARAVWEVMEECGIDPTRTFCSDAAMRAFDDEDTKLLSACPDCGSTDPLVREPLSRSTTSCDDPSRWHALRVTDPAIPAQVRGA